ncbi:hypothetical protein Pmani_038627 [Petrolisthes manimaculis]|uniref:Ig-like domain-containing protein n=1 Tax=Petrolisthes manimaculis TaxID=1843537 RepID=A0AAE1NDZ2_9EUCA|nr:hypothetical protein Pmani_038627 [Petrolisthes manimaculis]
MDKKERKEEKENEKEKGVSVVPVARLGVDGAAGGDNVTVREGATITLTCRLTANPSVYNLTFYHNGRPMVLEGTAGGGQGVRRSLVLNNVTEVNRGLYTCLASNQVGDGQSNALNINIECE